LVRRLHFFYMIFFCDFRFMISYFVQNAVQFSHPENPLIGIINALMGIF